MMLVTWPQTAQARRNGIMAPDCDGCHQGTAQIDVDLEVNPPAPQPGDAAVLTLTVGSNSMSSFGFYLEADEFGGLDVVTGQPTSTFDDFSVTHNNPISASGSRGSVQIAWRVPDEPGGILFHVAVVAANGDNRQSGDSSTTSGFNIAWGCDGVQLFADSDGDGFGQSARGTKIGCGRTTVWATADGDCNDNNQSIYPGASEVCNGKDDDCDGEEDEDAAPRTVYLDEDGDGYGTEQQTQLACEIPAGFADNPSDCYDRDAEIYPDAVEVCNGFDDDCDGDVDENVKPRCGVGWCERLAVGCDPNDCHPGDPLPETCNYFDDDCDGVIDNGVLCAAGEVCSLGECRPEAEAQAEWVTELAPTETNVPAATGDSPIDRQTTGDATIAVGSSHPASPVSTSTSAQPIAAAPGPGLPTAYPETPAGPVNEGGSPPTIDATRADSAGCSLSQRALSRPVALLWSIALFALVYRRRELTH